MDWKHRGYISTLPKERQITVFPMARHLEGWSGTKWRIWFYRFVKNKY